MVGAYHQTHLFLRLTKQNTLYRFAINTYPHATLRTDGMDVGLPNGQMGNSEVGHVNLGAGRVVYQDLAKINIALEKKYLKRRSRLARCFCLCKGEQSETSLSRTGFRWRCACHTSIISKVWSRLQTFPKYQRFMFMLLQMDEMLIQNQVLHLFKNCKSAVMLTTHKLPQSLGATMPWIETSVGKE
ncbi:MAG: hypothetical protein CM15mP59_3170 [Flavobacteriaceae bacterium]|nr:MAG: hypothetical protein CM15mP59_3170 [Flavobacteriaceae bacterium]